MRRRRSAKSDRAACECMRFLFARLVFRDSPERTVAEQDASGKSLKLPAKAQARSSKLKSTRSDASESKIVFCDEFSRMAARFN